LRFNQRFDGHALRLVLHNPFDLDHLFLHHPHRFCHLCRGRALSHCHVRRCLCDFQMHLHLGGFALCLPNTQIVISGSRAFLDGLGQQRPAHNQ
jgi:hypothetical protein